MSSPLQIVRLTPTGRGAVAVLRVEGERAEEVCEARFISATGKKLKELEPQQLAFGAWKLTLDSREEVVLRRISATQFEVHCHGGPAIVQAVLNSLEAAAQLPQNSQITWETWLQSLHNSPRKTQAQRDLSLAITERKAGILLDQYHGALERELKSMQPCEPQGQARLQRLLKMAEVGLHLVKPWRVVLAGLPNVGKSSLLNAVLGYRRAIVFDEPGTTRDVVRATTAVEGWPVEFLDTAGTRASADPLETAGVLLSREQLAEADLVVLLLDASQPETPEEMALQAEISAPLLVWNKCDLPSVRPAPASSLPLSAHTGTGLPALLNAVVQRLIPTPPLPGEAVPFRYSDVEALRLVLELSAAGPSPQLENLWQQLLNPVD